MAVMICKKSPKLGMTLLEVLIVLSTIMILAGAVLVGGKTLRQRADERLTRSLLEVLNTALQVYYDENGTFPTGGLYQALNASPGSRKIAEAVSASLIKNGSYRDAWDTPIVYVYQADMVFPTLIACGPDQMPDTRDDIRNTNGN